MNKLALSVAAISLTALTAITSCSSEKKDKSTLVSEKAAVEGVTNIRFYDIDSVSAHYKLVEELNAAASGELAEYQRLSNSYQRTLQTMAENIQNKLNNNQYLSEESYNQDMAAFQNKQQEAERVLGQRQNDIAEKAARQQQQLIDSINNFLRDYVVANGFDAVVTRQPGEFFSDDLDITDEVIDGLNARYTSAN